MYATSTNIKGSIKNVIIDNVKVYKISDTVVSRISGYSDTANIDEVHISNIEIAGKKINSIPTPTESRETQGDLDIPSFLRKKGNK